MKTTTTTTTSHLLVQSLQLTMVLWNIRRPRRILQTTEEEVTIRAWAVFVVPVRRHHPRQSERLDRSTHHPWTAGC